MIKLNRGDRVYFQGKQYAVFKVKDLSNVLIRDLHTNAIQQVQIYQITDRGSSSEEIQDPYELPIEAYPKKKVEKAKWRLAIITPFLGDLRGDKKALERTAKANNLSVSTLYNWIGKFNDYGHLGCLIDNEMKGGKDKGRFEQEIEDQIAEIINEVYLEGKSFKKTYTEIVVRFKELEYKIPHQNSIRRRIKMISDYEKISRRMGARTAGQKYDPKIGKTPGANTPLSLVQIDHTLLDIMLVDQKERKSFKRPWITVLIDVYSRVVLGFYISFDPPGAYAVGRAIAHAILRKEKYLKSIGLDDVEWPCWGKMSTLYCDNAKEFRGFMLKESCVNYKITLKWRPPKRPEMGGHIERYMGTISEELKDLPGTTKVSKEMRAKFKPEKTAAFTIGEFEKWFTLWVTEVYHKRKHRGIDDMMPIEKWTQGILKGDLDHPPIGAPEIITDETKLRLDLLPQYWRTIQRTGVHILKFRYFSGVLRKWINSIDETVKGKKKRKFLFKMDPSDISSILFLNPTDKKYHDIPTTLNIKPHKISIWDYRRAVDELKKERKKVDEASIYRAYKKMAEMEEQSKKSTKNFKKRLEREDKLSKDNTPKAIPQVPELLPPVMKILNDEIKPYEELEYNTPRRSFR